MHIRENKFRPFDRGLYHLMMPHRQRSRIAVRYVIKVNGLMMAYCISIFFGRFDTNRNDEKRKVLGEGIQASKSGELRHGALCQATCELN